MHKRLLSDKMSRFYKSCKFAIYTFDLTTVSNKHKQPKAPRLMDDKRELIKNFSGIALTTGIALAVGGTGNIALGVLGSIAGNLASSFIEKSDYSKIQSLLKQPDPSNLNHDLTKLIVKSVGWAIKNIEFLYKKNPLTQRELDDLKAFNRKLLEEVKLLEKNLNDSDRLLYKFIENPISADDTLRKFDLQIQKFPVINAEQPYPLFFKQQFIPNIQLCFGELLKKNRAALIAYQREVYQSLEASIDRVVAQNNEMLGTLKKEEAREVSDRNKKLRTLQSAVKPFPRSKPTEVFLNEFYEQLAGFSAQTHVFLELLRELKLDVGEIKEEVRVIKEVTKLFGKELRGNWLEKNKVWVSSLIGVAALIICGLVYYLRSLPFLANISLQVDSIKVNPQYPPLSHDAKIKVYLPYETREKAVKLSDEIVLANLPRRLENRVFPIELIDPYWTLSSDSIRMLPGSMKLSIAPNNALARIDGRVLSRDGELLLENARVIVESMETITDQLGTFTLLVPVTMRKLKFVVRVESNGYQTIEEEYIPGSPKEFRLSRL